MKRSFEHVVEIDASADDVWRALADFPAYGRWNPFMRRVTGRPTVGSRLRIELAPDVGRTLTVTPEVVAATPGSELRWRGRLAMPGLFGGEHAFLIEPGEGRSVRLVHRGSYRGLLVRLFGRTIDRTAHGFERMEHALKGLVETRGHAAGAALAADADRERARIAAALHDDVLQTLVAVVIVLDRLVAAHRSGEGELATDLAVAARRMVGTAMRRTGQLTFELSPPLLAAHGLGVAVTRLVADLAPGPRPSGRVAATDARWPAEAEQVCFRALRRIVSELAGRPDVGRITVTIAETKGGLEADVYWDARDTPDLAVVAERIRLAGGGLRVATEPQGMRVSLALPVPALRRPR
jgi:signal transduction histidine kinase